jgi:aminoglycoside phosphotransferase (APT) family kinase protein
MYAKYVAGFIKQEPGWYREIWARLNAHFEPKPITLVHGDCRLGNMIFLEAAGTLRTAGGAIHTESVVFSDWEAVNAGPAVHGLARPPPPPPRGCAV